MKLTMFISTVVFCISFVVNVYAQDSSRFFEVDGLTIGSSSVIYENLARNATFLSVSNHNIRVEIISKNPSDHLGIAFGSTSPPASQFVFKSGDYVPEWNRLEIRSQDAIMAPNTALGTMWIGMKEDNAFIGAYNRTNADGVNISVVGGRAVHRGFDGGDVILSGGDSVNGIGGNVLLEPGIGKNGEGFIIADGDVYVSGSFIGNPSQSVNVEDTCEDFVYLNWFDQQHHVIVLKDTQIKFDDNKVGQSIYVVIDSKGSHLIEWPDIMWSYGRIPAKNVGINLYQFIQFEEYTLGIRLGKNMY